MTYSPEVRKRSSRASTLLRFRPCDAGQSIKVFTQPDQVHLNELGDSFDATLWYDHPLRYDRGDLEQNLDSAWGPGWEESQYLKEQTSQEN